MPKLNQLVGTSTHNLRKEQNIEVFENINAERNTWSREKRVWRNTQGLKLFNKAVITAELPEWGAGEDMKCGSSALVFAITPCAWSFLVCAITSVPGSSVLVCAITSVPGSSVLVCAITSVPGSSALVCAITSVPGSSALVCANPKFA